MASHAVTQRKSSTAPDWRAAWRRSMRRSMQVAGAALLFLAMLFLGLAMASYSQTDPSPSTAAAGAQIANWMGAPGAWASERVLFVFGVPGVLLLPLLYVAARKLWRDVEEDDRDTDTRWWSPVLVLLLAMALFATVASLAFTSPGGSLPASMGGLTGLLGASGVQAIDGQLARAFGEDFEGWTTLALALLALGAAVALTTRVFVIDWAQLVTLPRFAAARLAQGRGTGTARDMAEPDDADAVVLPRKTKRAEKAGGETPVVIDTPRRAPDIPDPSAPPKQAVMPKARQSDMFAQYSLPSLDLLTEPAAPDTATPKLDKLALERNARLLETVLADFNVKGEIVAVRTGPVVTMYELEPAPGIKASRVIGLAEDIARNMSAISARVSPIPGKTVMGIELPNADRQMVVLHELAACAAFAEAEGGLPIILGKDIAGEPVVADLAAMPHLLVAGTTGSGKSVGLNCILLIAALPLHARRMPPDPDRSQGAGTEDLRRHPAPPFPCRHRTAQVGARAEMGGGGNGAPLSHDVQYQQPQSGGLQRESQRRDRQGRAAGPPCADRLRPRNGRGTVRGRAARLRTAAADRADRG